MSSARGRRPWVPTIGVTGPDAGGATAWHFARLALNRARARAVRITPSRPADPGALDGLVLGGGADVSVPLVDLADDAPAPSTVHWPKRTLDLALAPLVLGMRLLGGTRSRGIDHARDHLELRLLAAACELQLPVLGICRGAQLMNVAAGGTLLHCVQGFYEERPQLYTVLPRREVAIVRDSRLAEVLGRERILVNSLHFHAVDKPGENMRIVAREPNGVAQAIEHVGRRFWIGVQWHPELLPQHSAHQQLFHGLVAAVVLRSV